MAVFGRICANTRHQYTNTKVHIHIHWDYIPLSSVPCRQQIIQFQELALGGLAAGALFSKRSYPFEDSLKIHQFWGGKHPLYLYPLYLLLCLQLL